MKSEELTVSEGLQKRVLVYANVNTHSREEDIAQFTELFPSGILGVYGARDEASLRKIILEHNASPLNGIISQKHYCITPVLLHSEEEAESFRGDRRRVGFPRNPASVMDEIKKEAAKYFNNL